MGILWAIKPHILQNRLKKKMSRKLRFAVYGFIVVFGFLMAGSVFKAPGALAKLAGVIGLIIAIKGILLLTSKASDKMQEWIAAKSLMFFRIWALIILATGLVMLFS